MKYELLDLSQFEDSPLKEEVKVLRRDRDLLFQALSENACVTGYAKCINEGGSCRDCWTAKLDLTRAAEEVGDEKN